MLRILLSRYDAATGTELWASDGTSTGTWLLKDIVPGPAGSNPQDFVVIGDTVFFTADDGTHGRELWKTNGTAAGTVLVSDITPGPNGSTIYLSPAVMSGILYFAAHGAELWRSDGTAAGTYLVADINPGAAVWGIAIGNILYFAGDDGVHGRELWGTDGTATGTFLIADLNPGPLSSNPQSFVNYNGVPYFTTSLGGLWRSDGTAAGTENIATNLLGVASLSIIGNQLYFAGFDFGPTFTLWTSDGTASGTYELDNSAWFPSNFVLGADGRVYFSAESGLWSTDGTYAGTWETRAGVTVAGLTAVGPDLYFAGDNHQGAGVELWKSDGTYFGTSMVEDLYPGTHTFWVDGPPPFFLPHPIQVPNSSSPNALMNGDGTLYFAATDLDGNGLWRSDGSAVGTEKVSPMASAQAVAIEVGNPINTNDLNGDGKSDIVWRHDLGALVTWELDGGAIFHYHFLGQPDNSHQVEAIADFDGNGTADILFRHDSGFVTVLDINHVITNTLIDSTPNTPADEIVGTGNFNGDGIDEALWRNVDTGVVTWHSLFVATNPFTGEQISFAQDFGPVPSDWTVVGTGDVNGDGKTDIFWRHDSGQLVCWEVDDGTIIGYNDYGHVGNEYHFEGTGDFNGDGKSGDVLWRHDLGQVVTWELDGGAQVGYHDLGIVTNDYKIENTGDYNGDGHSDILWRHDTGQVITWELNGGSITGYHDFGFVDLIWQIQA